MARKKLPPYGAALRDLRRGGTHPLCVHLVYGLKWKAPCVCAWARGVDGEHPLLALKPIDYEPERYDFRVVTGAMVCVFDQEGTAANGAARLYSLLGELAEFAAEVEVYSPAFDMRYAAHELAGGPMRRLLNLGPVGLDGWASWWSVEVEEKNAKRRNTWLRAVRERVEQRLARA